MSNVGNFHGENPNGEFFDLWKKNSPLTYDAALLAARWHHKQNIK
jgi:hypothetical protein